MCIKRDGVEVFHSHSNSINTNIQFTVEMPTTTMDKNSIAFLDTSNIVNEDGNIEVGVHRKALPTIHTALCKAKELLLRPQCNKLNAFHRQLHKDRASSHMLSTTLKLMATLKTSSSWSLNQTTQNQSLGRTQKHMRQFHMLKRCQNKLDTFWTARTLRQLLNQ